MGVGGGTISIDGVVPPSLIGAPGGGWGWMDDGTCAGQADLGGGFSLFQLVLPNTITALDPAGASQFRAGNSKWAASLNPSVRSNILATLPLAGLGDIDETGRMTVVQNFGAGTGLVTYSAAGGTLWTQSSALTDPSNRLRSKNGSVAYQDGTGAWHLAATATGVLQSFAPRTGETVVYMVPVLIGTVLYVVELTNTQLTIRPATSPMGYVLGTGSTFFNADAVSLTSTSVRVGWSVTAGENPTDLRLADITLTSGMTTPGSTSSGPLVFGSAASGTTGSFTVGPVEGGSLSSTKQPRAAMKPDGTGFQGSGGVRQYQAWWDTLAGQAVAPANLSQATGVLPPANGGTGGTSGLTVLDGGNILPGTIPCSAIQADCLTALSGSWIPLVTGSEPPVFVTDGSGVLILVAGPS